MVSPMPFRGDASGHDFLFHLASWMDVAGQWREGIFYPRWAEWANWGFGEPRFVFYPPASWISGAALGSMLPWRMVPATLIWLTLIAAGMAMWKLARTWLAGPQAAVAAVLYAVNPYHLVIVYYRSDFAELMAAALFPLLVWAALRAVQNGWRGVPALAVVFAAIWLTNAPAGVIATYSLALIIVAACILRGSIRSALACAAGMILGFGLAAFYILPAAWEQRWVQIGLIASDELHPSQNFLFAHANDPDFVAFNWKVSAVAIGLMCITAVAVALSARRRRELREVWWILVGLAAASALLMFPLTAVLWRSLPKLQFVQFPWRWLDVLDLAFAFFVATALFVRQRRGASWLVFAILVAGIGASGVAMARNAWWDTHGAPVLTDAIRSMQGYEGTDEYMPNGCDRSELPGNPDPTTRADGASATPAAPVEQVDSDSGAIVPLADARVDIESWSAERKAFAARVSAPVTLAPRLLGYPAWRVRVDGKAAHVDSQPMTAQVLLPLPPGTHRVEIDFRRTWDRRAGGVVSAIAFLALLAWEGVLWRRKTGSVMSAGDA
ncbi:MAG: 6-pyruvoyl-tetrahydropterin synthase-related protein [Candidatus Acidiferrales bacterium]